MAGARGKIKEDAAEWELPRGRHRLPRAVVHAHQKNRMLAALPEAVIERGISGLRVSDVLARSGVSRATFYQQFADVKECFTAAYLAAFEQLIRGIQGACGAAPDWPRGVLAAIDFTLEFAQAQPAEAQLLTLTDSACDPDLERHSRLARDQLIGILRSGRERLDSSPALLDLTEQALVGAVISVIGSRLSSGQRELQALKPELGQLVLAPYVGRREAIRLVESQAVAR